MTNPVINPQDRSFVEDQLRPFPAVFQKKLRSNYIEILNKHDRRTANLYLLNIKEQLDSEIIERLKFSTLNMDESDLKSLSSLKANKCKEIWRSTRSDNLRIPYKRFVAFIRKHGIESSFIRDEPTQQDYLPLIRRALNPSWWLQNLRKVQSRDIETVARALNFINKRKEIYASNLNVQRRRKQKKAQQDYLEKLVATNEDGEQFKLTDFIETSTANPYIRKSELMVRLRGFEEYAKEQQHVGLFLTVTCPSKYHRAYGISGDPTVNWNGSTPIDAQEYLKSIWSKMRASFKRSDLYPYGLRIAEPHHDGTPHWHLLLFVPVEHKAKLLEIMKRYSFEEDGDEKGADKHRFTVVEIDPTKGSATGYISKYVSKSIDGEHLESGVYGENPIEGAERVTTWASVWAIRQFQQIGGGQVSIWRELRRMKAAAEKGSVIEQARLAADSSDWKAYQEAMGGVICLRKDRPIQMVYEDDVNTDTGELRQNQYEELSAPKIFGIKSGVKLINTRPHTWKITMLSEEQPENTSNLLSEKFEALKG